MDTLHPKLIMMAIITFYNTITNEESIDIEDLESAFSHILTRINEIEDTNFTFNFYDCLEDFVDTYPDFLEIENNHLLVDDLDILEEKIADNIDISFYDDLIYDITETASICNILNIPIPHKETKEYFDLNSKIMQIYLNIAKYETMGISFTPLIKCLENYITNLKNKIYELDEQELLNISICISDFNSNLIEDGLFTTTGWHIALFSNNPSNIQKLRYERLSFLIEEARFANTEIEALDYEIPTFLTYFLILLNNFMQNNISVSLKNELIIKKYLLLSTPELHNIENYYLKNNTINDLDYFTLPKNYPETAFNILNDTVKRCILSLDISDKDLINNPYNLTNLIVNLLFIKTFLELSQNNTLKIENINLIKDSKIYASPKQFSIVIDYINSIIFTKQSKLIK